MHYIFSVLTPSFTPVPTSLVFSGGAAQGSTEGKRSSPHPPLIRLPTSHQHQSHASINVLPSPTSKHTTHARLLAASGGSANVERVGIVRAISDLGDGFAGEPKALWCSARQAIKKGSICLGLHDAVSIFNAGSFQKTSHPPQKNM